MIRKNLGLICGAMAFLVLILDSRAASTAAAEGVAVCIRTVIPCLFPLFLLSGYLTSGLSGGKWIARLFRCPKQSGGLLLTGFLAGYPVGAKQAAEACRAGQLTGAQAEKMLWFCSQAGPSFLFGMVAARLGGVRDGWILWLIQFFSALSVARLLPAEPEWQEPEKAVRQQKRNLMGSALTAMGSVCGWVIVFSVILAFMRRWVLWLLHPDLQVLVCGLLELTNGCLLLAEVSDPALRLLLAAVMLNFGGICVLMQTVSLTQGLKIRGYILGKLLQTAFAILYTLALLGHIGALIPVFTVFSLKFLLLSRKKSSIPAILGV